MTTKELWQLPPNEFNQWRRENDLPALFAGFQKKLPLFQQWLDYNEIDIDFILETNQPGNFFFGKKNLMIVEVKHPNSLRKQYFRPYDRESELLKGYRMFGMPTPNQKKLEPYFKWVKERLQTENVLTSEHGNKQDDFYFQLYLPFTKTPEDATSLSIGLPILKLGNYKLNTWSTLSGRNLDFTDLNYLSVEGSRQYLPREVYIFYSSLQYVRIYDSNIVDCKFYRCQLFELEVKNSKLFSFEFIQSHIRGIYFENCEITNGTFKKTSLTGFTYSRLEVKRLNYIPPDIDYSDMDLSMAEFGRAAMDPVKDNYVKLRLLYQNNGLRAEAAEAYYKERSHEMLIILHRLNLVKHFRNKKKSNLKLGLSNAIFVVRRFIKNFWKALSLVLSFLIWGFGERPRRVVISSLFIIFCFSCLFYFSHMAELKNNFSNSIYFSIVTFTTLGYGDISPKGDETFKIIAALEALIGAFLMGLLIAGYSNKSRY